MEYLGAWGTLIHEKNMKSKISCQTPFKRSIYRGSGAKRRGCCWSAHMYRRHLFATTWAEGHEKKPLIRKQINLLNVHAPFLPLIEANLIQLLISRYIDLNISKEAMYYSRCIFVIFFLFTQTANNSPTTDTQLLQQRLFCLAHQMEGKPEPEFLNFKWAQESIPKNKFLQTM